MKRKIYVLWLFVLLQSIGYSSDGCAQEVRYQYRLEEGHDKKICAHMTQVFNQQFRTPWGKGHGSLERNPSVFGIPSDQIFERLPDVIYEKDFTGRMLLSKFPSSSEFDAVHWQEGRFCLDSGSFYPNCALYPMLVAEIDIDNDGQKDWVIKTDFMSRMTTNEGRGQSYGGNDDLRIFRLEGFDPLAANITSEQLFHGQRQNSPPRVIDRLIAERLDTVQLRPFIYMKKTYLSAYQVYWPNLELSKQLGHNAKAKPSQLYPERENMNILRVTPGGERLFGRDIETANTETVCRIRMIMQSSQTNQKGK